MTPDKRAEAIRLAHKFLEHGHAYPLPLDCMNLAGALLATYAALEAAERERDGAKAHRDALELKLIGANGYAHEGDKEIVKLMDERDTARARLAEVERERDAWIETGAQYARNADYYRGLLDRVAPLFGEAAYIADDGSRATDPLRAKLPELADQLKRERDTARAQVETLAEALRRIATYEASDEPQTARAALKAAGVEP